jgi:hypothetical protein
MIRADCVESIFVAMFPVEIWRQFRYDNGKYVPSMGASTACWLGIRTLWSGHKKEFRLFDTVSHKRLLHFPATGGAQRIKNHDF